MLFDTDQAVQSGGALGAGQMEAMLFARSIRANVGHRNNFLEPSEVIAEIDTKGFPTQEQWTEHYTVGDALLKQYSCDIGPRETAPFAADGTPVDPLVGTAYAWLLVESGYIAHKRAYAFVTFNPRPVYHIHEEMLGGEATEAHARKLVELLQGRGYQVDYSNASNTISPIRTGDWLQCLQALQAEDTQ